MEAVLLELIIGLLANAFQLGCFVLVAAIVPGLVYFKSMNKKLFKKLLIIFLAAELLGVLHLIYNPFYSCPEEYQEYVSERDERSITGPSFGTYSTNIPMVRLWVRVTEADENEIIFETCYFPGVVVGRSLGDGFSQLYPNW